MGKSSAFRGVTLFRPTGKWRAQISAGGKTTSLGDHDTEIDAARAFDRAAINKAGSDAKTNFNVEAYADEIEDLQGMSQAALVAMLRSRARKSSTQTSHFRGVSLLKQTSKWHAQINVGGKQVHLGFFGTEEQAARAYDRAAINKGARDNCKIITNFDINDYADELELLQRIGQDQLVAALASEAFRRQTMAMLSGGFAGKAEEIFGEKASKKESAPVAKAAASKPAADLIGLMLKAERAQPKPTARNPIYANFGKKAKGSTASRHCQKAQAAAASSEQDFPTSPEKSDSLGKRVRRPSSRLGPQKPAARSTDSDTTEEDWSSENESEGANVSEAAKARMERKARVERITAALAAARAAKAAEPPGNLLDAANTADDPVLSNSWQSPEQRAADQKPLLDLQPCERLPASRALQFNDGLAQSDSPLQSHAGRLKELPEGEEAASDQTTDAVASKHAPAAAAASSLATFPDNESADAHPDELSLALDLQSLQDLQMHAARPEGTALLPEAPVVMTKRHQRLIRPPRRLDDEPEAVSSRASRPITSPVTPACPSGAASPADVKMAGTPLMELVAALEREEEMQTDGAAAPSDPPATPKAIVHPEDPLHAESRPSTAKSGRKRPLLKSPVSPDDSTPHKNRRVRQAPHRAA
ncbi:hypothetical protein WJX74_002304 [Apatococcus lobatus]|uniref:AP2/ERF domain-containing protein n=2 Tax=Apatococcus TaxID=904362 RepID=A0AAW1SUE4_9CHLO